MSETTNYGLHLTDNSSERFQDWREKMSGTDGSNMIKIDVALGEKANKSVAITTTLMASAWAGIEAPFTQELSITGLAAEQNGEISIAHNATPLQRDIARSALLAVTGQSEGKLMIVADGELPEQDIPVSIILFG
ncbi:hypothetical protein AALD01_02665 [Oscillospiraceae bacterium 21-37]